MFWKLLPVISPPCSCGGLGDPHRKYKTTVRLSYLETVPRFSGRLINRDMETFAYQWPFVWGIYWPWIPLKLPIKQSRGVLFNARLNKLSNEQSSWRWFETPPWCHYKLCNENVVILTTFSSLAALEVVKMITQLPVHPMTKISSKWHALFSPRKHAHDPCFVESGCNWLWIHFTNILVA